MSKRETTGLPDKDKSRAKQPVVEKSRLAKAWDNALGNPKNNRERDEATARILVRLVIGVCVVVAVLVAISFSYNQFVVPNQAVATVNGETISVSDFQDRVKLEQVSLQQQINSTAQQLQQFGMDPNEYLTQNEPYKTYLNELNFPDQLGQRVLDTMIDDKLAQQEAAKLNIVVSDEQIQQKVNAFFNYDPTRVALTGAEPTATQTATVTPVPYVSPTPTPTPTETPLPSPTVELTAEVTAEVTVEAVVPTATIELPTFTPEPTRNIEEQQQDFQNSINDYNTQIRQQTGVGQAVIDASFRREALQDAIAVSLLGDPATTTYVNLRHILVATEEEAQDVIAALKAGESFAELAAAVSTDTGSAQNGGVYTWAPASNYVEEFKNASETLPIGEISEPIKTQFGYHVMQVIGREDRPIEESLLAGVKTATYNAWVKALRTANEANIIINDDWVNYVPISAS